MEKESITLVHQFPVSAAKLYHDWLDSAGHSKMTGGEATASKEMGASFTAWDGYISGTNLELVSDKKIVQSWRTMEFETDWEDSRLEILLEQHEYGTEVTLIHSNLAPGDGEKYGDGWKKHYFKPMTRYYGRAQINLSVDAVVFGRQNGKTAVLLIERKNPPYQNCWAIPGGFVDQDESLEDAAKRELEEETSISVDRLEQLHAYGNPDRDPRGRVVSVAYWGIVDQDKHKAVAADDAKNVQWFELDKLPKLAFDHQEILNMAIDRAK